MSDGIVREKPPAATERTLLCALPFFGDLLLGSAAQGCQSFGNVPKIVMVYRVHHMNPVLVDACGIQGSGNCAADRCNGVGIAANVGCQKDSVLYRLGDHRETYRQRDLCLRPIGKILAGKIIGIELCPA